MPGATATLHAALDPRALNVEGAAAPAWIELIPAGAIVAGHDGRRWANPDPAAVVAATRAANRPIPVDWEHATQERAPKGEEAPAAGWVEELDVRDGAIWGRVDWTPRAACQVRDREYRYTSPVFAYERAAPHRIIRVEGVGLTNTPNLPLTALNRAEHHTETETTLDLARLREALGLPADANDDAIITGAREAKALNSRGPDMTKFAPRADLDTAINRATTAESALAARAKADQDAAIETALNTAAREGKVTPASRPHYLAMCKVEGGLAAFNELAKTLPVIAGAAASAAAADPAKKDGGEHGLTDEELAVCKARGQDPVAFAKLKKEG